MIIKKINKLRNFGIFEKFDWDSTISPFSVFNLIYGWNYSGKTTLSRVFRSYELGSKHPDYTSANFEIEDIADIKTSETHFPNKTAIRVFNCDFIFENLKWNDSEESIQPILLLGVENIALQKELQLEKEKIQEHAENIKSYENAKREEDDKIFHALTTKAREIKSNLLLLNFDKRHFEPKVAHAATLSDKATLTDDEVSRLCALYKSTDKKDAINPVPLSIPNILKIYESADILLKTMVKAKIIERLKEDINLNAWVKKGKDLHENKTICEFCSNTLPLDLLENLSYHFSEDYNELIENLEKEIIKNTSLKIKLILPDTANFYRELQSEYLEIKAALEAECVSLNDSINSINDKIQEKKVRIFDVITNEVLNDKSKSISHYLEEINEIIKKHNAKSQDFEREKEHAYTTLLNHYSMDFCINEKYPESLILIEELEKKIIATKLLISINELKVLEIEAQLSETVKGAEKINEYLKYYFGKEDVKVIVTPENNFRLQRGSNIAKNLSEGEKTAIAFAYFITRLEDKSTNLENTIVYLDDPISSLDSNHLFNTYSFIKDKFYYYDTSDKKHKCKASQLFISTHNFEFFNLIKDLYEKMKKGDKSFYLIERITNSALDQSAIKTMPITLLKFKSEYTYLFSIIYAFKITPSTDFNQLYNLPNIIRRYIETFTAFKYLSTKNIEENIEQLIPDTVKCEMVRKFVHYHSHSLNTNRVLQFSDPTECLDVINIILDSVKDIDEVHYNALLEEVTVSE